MNPNAYALQPGTSGFRVSDDYRLIHRLAYQSAERRLPLAHAEREGFYEDHYTEYRMPSMRRRRPGARAGADGPERIVVPVDCVGPFYVALILYDTAGAEAFDVAVDGKLLGRITARRDDNRQYLYVSESPVQFGVRSALELTAAGESGQHRIEDVRLLESMPKLIVREPEIRDIRAAPAALVPTEAVTAQPGDTILAWRTDDRSCCTVELADAAGAWTTAPYDSPTTNNHRLVLRGLKAGGSYRVRIAGRTRHGWELTPRTFEFAANAFAPGGADPTARAPAATEGVRISLARDKAARVGADRQPVTFGVPYAPGALTQTADLVLRREPDGRPIAAQFRVAAHWPDSSIKWVHVDAQCTTDDRSWTLTTGSGVNPAPDTPVTVTRGGGSLTVSTGPLRFTVAPNAHSLVQAVDCKGPDGAWTTICPELALVGQDEAGRPIKGAPPQLIEVEESGPMRVCIRLRGAYIDDDARPRGIYDCRVHAYAGLSWLKLSWTFENDRTEQDFSALGALSLRAPLAGPAEVARLATAGGAVRENRAIRLVQWFDDRCSLTTGHDADAAANAEQQAGREAGWAECVGPRGGVGAAVEHFWQRYPKGFIAGSHGLDVELLPKLASEVYEAFADTELESRLLYFFRGGSYHIRQGASFSETVLLSFSPPGAAATGIAPLAGQAAEPPTPVLDPIRYEQTRVFGDLGLVGAAVGDAYERTAERCLDAYVQDQAAIRAYGFLNFGDWWGERRVNWGNCEYDTPQAFLLQFVRSGDPRYLRIGLAADAHHRDVDTVRHHVRQERVGQVCLHSIGHTGGYYSVRRPEWGPGMLETLFTVDHTWVDGHLSMYFLTGDRRALETADLVGKRYAGRGTEDFDFANCRVPGWHLVLATAMYEATNDPIYLNAARIVVERVLERQTPDGGWRREMVPEHCHDLPRHAGNAGFMVGVLLSGLRRYHAITGDEAVRNAILRGVRFLVDDMWVPSESAFRYTSCPNSAVFADLNFLMLDGIAFAARHTGDPQLREVLRAGALRHIRDSAGIVDGMNIRDEEGIGKLVSMTLCFTPAILGALESMERAPETRSTTEDSRRARG